MTTWKHTEAAVLAAAVSRAPSGRGPRPWLLEFHDHEASILERVDSALPRHDPLGRGRVLSCGAAVTNLRVAVRSLGWSEGWLAFPDPDQPDELARVIAGRRDEPDDEELATYRAIRRRTDHTGHFGAEQVPADQLRALVSPFEVPGVDLRVLGGVAETTGLTPLLRHAASVLRGDEPEDTTEPAHPGTPPWNAPPRSDTAESLFADRMATGTHLLVSTVEDDRDDHLRAGMALQQVWLAATVVGLAATAITRPLYLPEIRADLVERLDLAGHPQALLRIGTPVEALPPVADLPELRATDSTR